MRGEALHNCSFPQNLYPAHLILVSPWMRQKFQMITSVFSHQKNLSVFHCMPNPYIQTTISLMRKAGVTPFVVAGIEFRKRIIAQKRCEECGGSGLVLREKEYFRCPECGGFLPWQSWKRFFSG
ncbi:uncharacterized protein LOC124833578 isoform X2 [Vigna umbellata]|uniref:uncharacterized protein LOC124833578 isoform X2 n=1 Tax=Vigna umbellata TaxID=87088 RepID=UPI001F5FDDB3|nr:uncharacterized protein LOC124833578 isoform X2 [Vigna umbellata]